MPSCGGIGCPPSTRSLTSDDDVEAWIAPLRRALADVNTSEEAIAALRESVLPALEAAVAEHRDAINPLLDGPTARVLDLVSRRPRPPSAPPSLDWSVSC